MKQAGVSVCSGLLVSVLCASGPSMAVGSPPTSRQVDSITSLFPERTTQSSRELPGFAPRGEPEVICVNVNCQNLEYPRVASTGLISCGTGHANLNRVADQFRTDAAGGVLSSVCWWGSYTGVACGGSPPADRFFVTVYPRVNSGPNAGIPDTTAPLGAWSQTAGTLTVTRRALCNPTGTLGTWEYTATLVGGVALAPNTCYFLEIRNTTDGTTNWAWARAAFVTDGFAFQDTTSNGYALTELADLPLPPTGTGDRAFCLNVGIDLFSPGSAACLPTSDPPINDACDAATAISIDGPRVIGSTLLANPDFALPCGDARENQGPGVWFTLVGDGSTLTASTCFPGTSSLFNSKISVYCGDSCFSLSCVAGNDDAPACGTNVGASSVSWCAESGRTYYILLHGLEGSAGAYEIGVTSDGSACVPTVCVPCEVVAPIGAIDELEGCGFDTNGGCSTSSPPQPFMTPIACGQTVFGTAWASGGARDTDWYLLSLAETQQVTITMESEFPGVSFIIQYADLDTCFGMTFVGGTTDQNSCDVGVNTAILTGPGDYVIFAAVGSTGGGGTFEGVPCDGINNDYILTVDCAALCAGITIPPEAVNETELCQGDTNGGCETDPPLPAAFAVVPGIGATIHGTSFAAAGVRDTDWFRATAPPDGFVSVTVTAEFPCTVLLLEIELMPGGRCSTITTLAAANISACSTDVVSTAITGGSTYYIFIAPGTASSGIFDGLPCSQDYVLTVLGDPAACACDWNQSGTVDSQDFFDYLIAFFSGNADINNDNLTNSQDFFDFLACFFSPPMGC